MPAGDRQNACYSRKLSILSNSLFGVINTLVGMCMASEELLQSWKRTEGFLLDARSHLSEVAEADCADEIEEFNHFLEHNELELALNSLEVAFEKSSFENWRVLELLALAAASMGLLERQKKYDEQLSKARGWEYHTELEQ